MSTRDGSSSPFARRVSADRRASSDPVACVQGLPVLARLPGKGFATTIISEEEHAKTDRSYDTPENRQ
jgi:hypothetical protein